MIAGISTAVMATAISPIGLAASAEVKPFTAVETALKAVESAVSIAPLLAMIINPPRAMAAPDSPAARPASRSFRFSPFDTHSANAATVS